MIVNFCVADLVTKISSSVCDSDGHSVKNLISKVEFERKKGFLADYFIKPPITIDFQFLCDIQLSHIILWTRVGAQKTIGVELFTSSNGSSFYSIGYAFMKNEKTGFLFCKRDSDANIIKRIDSSNFFVQFFKPVNLMEIKNLQIKILKTLGSSVPALQKVEIWGKIGKNCSKKTVDLVMRTLTEIKNISMNTSNTGMCTSTNNVTMPVRDELDLNKECEIPDEFLDAISWEIMTIPMILPCGKIIDNSTLQRYINEEAKWGRFPSDPFTGKLFSEESRPKMSVALKARIDKFLLENCNKSFCKNLPRTVGDNQPNKPKVSVLLSNIESKARTSGSFDYTCKNQNLDVKCNIQAKTYLSNNKRKFSSSESINNMENNLLEYSESELHPKKLQSCNEVAQKKKNVCFQKYDEMKEQSLECLLKRTLSSLPSYSKNSCPENRKIFCFKCNSVSILYELPCRHHVCRQCLSAMIETNCFVCLKCSKKFKSCDPKRVHMMNL